jgi:DNA mismatch endonuclease (patch repair protein)
VADRLSPAARSRLMAGIKSKNTAPELQVRRALHGAGLRYRLHRRDLPGHPDLAFSRARVAVLVHGCFWHRHSGCSRAYVPASNRDYWEPKFRRTVERDAEAVSALKKLGWVAVVIWECEIAQNRLDEIVGAVSEALGRTREGRSL